MGEPERVRVTWVGKVLEAYRGNRTYCLAYLRKARKRGWITKGQEKYFREMGPQITTDSADDADGE